MLDKSLKVLNFSRKNSMPLKVLEVMLVLESPLI
jgi:hypothetical protein